MLRATQEQPHCLYTPQLLSPLPSFTPFSRVVSFHLTGGDAKGVQVSSKPALRMHPCNERAYVHDNACAAAQFAKPPFFSPRPLALPSL